MISTPLKRGHPQTWCSQSGAAQEVAAVAYTMSAYFRLDAGAGVRMVQQQVQQYCPDMDAALTAVGEWASTHPAPPGPPLVDIQWLAGVGGSPCALAAWAQPPGCPNGTY